MFLKSFLVFSCLVLYRPTLEVNPNQGDIEQLLVLVQDPLLNVSGRVPKINFTFAHNLCEKHQAIFCEVSEVLKNCTDYTVGQLQRLSHQMKGNVTCKFQANGTSIRISKFWSELKSYVESLHLLCPKN